MAQITEQEVSIPGPSSDLAGRLFSVSEPEITILINGATGVPARYYAAFAAWLAQEKSAQVLIWDYRDFGASGARDQARKSRANMRDWGVEDAAAARHWAYARSPDLPLWVIGHSLGGLTLPFQQRLHEVSRVITIASGPVHLSDHPWPMRAGVAAYWHGYGPPLTAALGYLPGRRLFLGADIPGPVFWQWRRWCNSAGSCRADKDMPPLTQPGLSCPVTLIAFADDAMVPPQAVWRLGSWMQKATVSRRLITAANHGLKSIGHVSAFAARNRAVWPELIR